MTGIATVTSGPRPSVAATAVTAYRAPRPGGQITLDLANTAMSPYPDSRALAARLAQMVGVSDTQILVTAGADEALERAFRAVLSRGDEVILTSPTFEMLPRYARLVGATIREVAWTTGALPVEKLLREVNDNTRLIVIVSPNNPTGAVASLDALREIARSAPDALLVVDLAYVEFAEADPTVALLAEPGIVVTRTFSKAWGLPGIRVGWAAGPPDVIEWMRRVGNPYPIAAESLARALAAVKDDPAGRAATREAIIANRVRLTALLVELALEPLPSEANFVCIRPPRAAWLRDALAGMGVSVRLLADAEDNWVRITCPVTDKTWFQLEAALRTVLSPQTLLFDMDGVLADVTTSYRQAIIETAASFGVTLLPSDIAAAKAAGHANDDWQLTTDLLKARGTEVPLATVKCRFESIYQGEPGRPGLRESETLLVSQELLEHLASRFPLGIVTGRPRADAERFLERFGLTECFSTCVTRDDGPLKPDPFPVGEAMRRLDVSRAWMIGDTPDDVQAARAAGALPVGVLPPQSTGELLDTTLRAAGAAWVLPSTNLLEEVLP